MSGTPQGAGGVGGLLAVSDAASSTTYPFYDGNGNVMGYFDATAGTTVAEFEYGPFGELIRATGSQKDDFNFRFSTKYEDAETGLLYYGFRYYDPTTGRWPSRDPIGERGGLNLYGMVGNNAVNAWDLLGLISFNFSSNCSAKNQRILTEVGNSVGNALSSASRLFGGSGSAGNSRVDGIMSKWFVNRTDFAAYPFTVQVVSNVVGSMNDAAQNDTIDVKCDGTFCSGLTLGYVLKFVGRYRWSITICCKNLDMDDKEAVARVLIHEMAHRYGQVEDYGYYEKPSWGTDPSNGWYIHPDGDEILEDFTSNLKLSNADTYAFMLLSEFYKK